MSIFLVTCAGAGEYVKARNVTHYTKLQQVDVGDVEGHVILVYESKGVTTNLEGKWFCDGWAHHETGVMDINTKTGLGSGHGYGCQTDRDGNKFMWTWEGKAMKGGKFGTGYWEATWKAIKGTGKFEGIQAKGTVLGYSVGDEGYADWEGEVEFPR